MLAKSKKIDITQQQYKVNIQDYKEMKLRSKKAKHKTDRMINQDRFVY